MVNPVDIDVGKRIRHRRKQLGITQMALANDVGVRFQQVQKYETGSNRVSASRLWELSRALDVHISYFFEGLGVYPRPDPAKRSNALLEEHAVMLVTAYTKIPKEKRKALLRFAKALSSP
ncbi:helix-turn-helix domain-containing protein [Roseovarius aestuarii]|uniref:Transcriptional repressor DicA n=1 Tax=Roseovarius aestuarii TaxID=475083 RepID=A0A1X7BX26_9RHOB|nr:helix-turn-helix transcriptional regulator [Roseovarius aestuarii]SMC14055.1 transcriptional repressor DicA [Roseovarius aestuarii]